MVTVLFYTGNSLLERAIKWFTRSVYTHTAILVDGVLYEALAHGVLRRTGNDAAQRAAQAIAYAVVPVSTTPRALESGYRGTVTPTSRLADMVRFLNWETTDPYSVTQLLADGIAILTGHRWIIAADGTWTCSGLVAAALTTGGVDIQRPGTQWLDPDLFSPADLADVLRPKVGTVPLDTIDPSWKAKLP